MQLNIKKKRSHPIINTLSLQMDLRDKNLLNIPALLQANTRSQDSILPALRCGLLEGGQLCINHPLPVLDDWHPSCSPLGMAVAETVRRTPRLTIFALHSCKQIPPHPFVRTVATQKLVLWSTVNYSSPALHKGQQGDKSSSSPN